MTTHGMINNRTFVADLKCRFDELRQFIQNIVDMTSPELHVSQWLNTDDDITLASLLGKVVVVEAFQMLCPGCVSRGLPLAQKVQRSFSKKAVTVLGLHTVF